VTSLSHAFFIVLKKNKNKNKIKRKIDKRKNKMLGPKHSITQVVWKEENSEISEYSSKWGFSGKILKGVR